MERCMSLDIVGMPQLESETRTECPVPSLEKVCPCNHVIPDTVGKKAEDPETFAMHTGTAFRNHLGSLWRTHTLTQGFVKPAALHLCVLPFEQDRRLCLARCAAAKHRVVFLGTPEVAADVLERLWNASQSDGASFQVAGVVSQPGRPKGRGKAKVPQPSPVEAAARRLGLLENNILCPVKASEPEFLDKLTAWAPDLCVTAAYGNILPRKFLSIPRMGTLNIHPSLLPAYRGAAPVQRALQDGCTETGVSVAFTVRAMDAGPILAQKIVSVDGAVQAPELLKHLFGLGTDLLLENLACVWSGQAAEKAQPQAESAVSHAAKISKEDGVLDFNESALTLHNKVRAFAGWPGTTANLSLASPDGHVKEESIKIVRTQLVQDPTPDDVSRPNLIIDQKRIVVKCGAESNECLEVLEVQPVGKKVMPALAFINGLNGRTVQLQRQNS